MRPVARRILQSGVVACLLMAGVVVVAIFVPMVATTLYLPAVVMLDVLEDQGIATLTGSQDGWPVPTAVGGWLAAGMIWSALTFALFIAMRLNDRRGERRQDT
jgi:hypothetical protein